VRARLGALLLAGLLAGCGGGSAGVQPGAVAPGGSGSGSTIESTIVVPAATVTPHHLIINRNALFAGGLRPHAYCLPVAKRELHRQALRRAVISGSDRFFLGTDTAPHAIAAKESTCGCAGIFCAPAAIETYASVFDELGALDRLEAFASINGPRFYGLPVNETTLTLERAPTEIPALVAQSVGGVRPFLGGGTIPWRVAEVAGQAVG